MHRAIAPTLIRTGILAGPAPAGGLNFLGGATCVRSTNVSYSGINTVSWNQVDYDDSLSLSAPVTTITVPSGAAYCFAVFASKDSATGASYYEHRILKNGSPILQTANHGGDYNKGIVSGWFSVTGGDTVAAGVNFNVNSRIVSGSWFHTRFYS